MDVRGPSERQGFSCTITLSSTLGSPFGLITTHSPAAKPAVNAIRVPAVRPTCCTGGGWVVGSGDRHRGCAPIHRHCRSWPVSTKDMARIRGHCGARTRGREADITARTERPGSAAARSARSAQQRQNIRKGR